MLVSKAVLVESSERSRSKKPNPSGGPLEGRGSGKDFNGGMLADGGSLLKPRFSTRSMRGSKSEILVTALCQSHLSPYDYVNIIHGGEENKTKHKGEICQTSEQIPSVTTNVPESILINPSPGHHQNLYNLLHNSIAR